MKRQSYKIKHDFLFDDEDTLTTIPCLDSNLTDYAEIKMSSILGTKDKEHFEKLINVQSQNIVIIDNIRECTNPASERYKHFIIRCICRKLSEHSKNYFLV